MNASAYLQSAATRALGLDLDTQAGFFSYGTKQQATLDDSQPMPQIHAFELKSIPGGSDKTERYEAVLYFATDVEGDNDDRPGLNEAIAEMRTLKNRFLRILDTNPLVEVAAPRDEELRGVLQARLTGVALAFQLTVPRTADALYC
ncbi:hypothetical protein HER32_11935 [Hymenobacter sp. BT18]|uniref:hypothetical protein n=1 Tax=Hymenobacter sp. BT18 TaxID=2835648 RepID=UPI00143E2AC9|nr:hypothetical protein [Hymenobacter sp. BT18]QIX61852.1 hypothetical protein HER32_11935 [Hymenobacter sp. BT18]